MEILSNIDISLTALLFLMFTGFFAGFIDSIAGGGGLITLPALMLAGVPNHVALGTNKLVMFSGTTASFIAYLRSKQIVWRVVVGGLIFCLLGSFVGAKIVLYIDKDLLGKIIAVLLPVVALFVLIPRNKNKVKEEFTVLTPRKKLYVTIICFILSAYDGCFGPGTGTFFLISLSVFIGLDLVKASATTKAFNLTSNFGALVVFVFYNQVNYLIALPMGFCAVLGNIVGSKMAIKGGAHLVKKVLIVSLTILFLTLFWQYFIKG